MVVDGDFKLTMMVLETDSDPQVHDSDILRVWVPNNDSDSYIRTLLSLLNNSDVQPVDNDKVPQWRVSGTDNDLQMLDNNCRETCRIDKDNDITNESDVNRLLMMVPISDNDSQDLANEKHQDCKAQLDDDDL